MSLTRRTTLIGGMALAASGCAVTGPRTAPAQARTRLSLPYGVQAGDVTTSQATLWARASGAGRLAVRLTGGPRDDALDRTLRGSTATTATDLTARLDLSGLRPGRRYQAALWFEDESGARGEVRRLTFRTAPDPARATDGATSFVWTGDTAGQGWGINPDLGGMTAYDAMRRTRPDFFVHAGDTTYSDSPIAESVTEPDGQVWRNVVSEGVHKVAESLEEFRGRHRYNLTDDNVRRMAAEVPVIPQWDDHETHNNWYPGEVLTDPAYSEKRVDVLAARSRQAWQEYQPIRTGAVRGRGSDGFAAQRIYRKIPRGPHLDVFCLDMRSYKGPNPAAGKAPATPILGDAQVQWLVREVARSTATWKVISADLPLGIVVPDGLEGIAGSQESLSQGDPGAPEGREHDLARVLSGFRRHGVRNTLWITADVHYAAAHHYSPERAAYTDFDPFWELVAGPISSGAFGPNAMDGTFGPEVVFRKVAAYPNQSPRGGTASFFGHVAIARDGELTASLRDGTGAVLWQRSLAPDAVGAAVPS